MCMTHIYINVHIGKCTYAAPKFGKNTKAMVCSDHPGAMGLGNGTWGKGHFYFLLL